VRSLIVAVLLSGCGGRVRDDAPADGAVREVAVTPAIAVGSEHGCVLRGDGRVLCWGSNGLGQLGVAGCSEECAPVLVPAASPARAIAASGRTTCVVLYDRRVACFGEAFRFAAPECAGELRCDREPRVVDGLANARTITVGSGWVCAANEDGTVGCAGDNPFGQVLAGGRPQEHVGRQIPELHDVAEVSAGHLHTCARTNAGVVRCWGDNSYGQLGERSTRTDVTTSLGARSLVATPTGTCITVDGGVRCFGANLGFPIPVAPLEVVSNAAVTTSLYLVRDDGTVNEAPSVAVALAGFRDVARFAASGSHRCGLTRGGAVLCEEGYLKGVHWVAVPP